MAAQTHDLDSLSDYPTVIIDGKPYELLTQDLLSPRDLKTLSVLLQRTDEINAKTGPNSDEEDKEIEEIQARLCRLVLAAPEEVHAKLDWRVRMKVLRCFFDESTAVALTTPPLVVPKRSIPTSTSSSPDSPTPTT